MVNRENQNTLRDRIAKLRKEYTKGFDLDTETVDSDPYVQFESWFAVATEAGLVEPNAMALATSTPDGKPSLRMVLLKECSNHGFYFYTNYASRKGVELSQNFHAALLFYWAELERQVRIEGVVERVPEANSDTYFASRPRGAQLGAMTSLQSQPIESRELLEKRLSELDRENKSKVIFRPKHWGGYVLKADRFEFWQGRENRLHDRMEYVSGPSGWKIQRLQP